jgi:hypothetical protein
MARFGPSALAVGIALLLVGPATAAADTVANPGTFGAQFTDGSLTLGTGGGGGEGLAFTAASPVEAVGTVAVDGNVSTTMLFPTVTQTYFDPFFQVEITASRFVQVFESSGTVNPKTGATVLHIRGKYFLTTNGLTACSWPFDAELTTGTSGTLTGTPYDPADGSIKLVDGTFSAVPLPAVEECQFWDLTMGTVYGAGQNKLTLTGKLDPILKPAPDTPTDATPPPGDATPPPGDATPPPQQPAAQVPAQNSDNAPQFCVVPKLAKLTLSSARTRIKAAHCTTGKVTSRKSSRNKGTVIGQTPKPGSRRAAGAKVNLIVSKGPGKKKRG